MISFCVSLLNRGGNFLNLLHSWSALHDGQRELIVADFGSTDIDLRTAATRVDRVRLAQLDGPFNRARGLNAAAACARGELLFFLDADIILPPDFCATIRQQVRRGQAYFPVCYALAEGSPPDPTAPGYWRTKGFGLCGFHRDDFAELGWDESFTRWGGEDNDLHRRAGERLQVVREKCPGLLHLWHPESRPAAERPALPPVAPHEEMYAVGQSGAQAGVAQRLNGRAFPLKRIDVASPRTRISTAATGEVLRRVTFGITAFERPRHVERLVASIQRYYPGARITVADNGREKACLPGEVAVVDLPFDCGLSAARDALAAQLATAYLLMLEDDFVFCDQTRIETFAEIMDSDQDLGSIGGTVRIGNRLQDYAIDLEVFRGVLWGRQASRPLRFSPAGTPYRYCDKHLNFGMWRREMLVDHTWAGLPKVGEHAPYFWRVKQAGHWRSAHCRSVMIDHDRAGRSPLYDHYRGRAWQLQNAWLAEHGIAGGYKQDAPLGRLESAAEKPNVVILGVGHSGTSVLAKMLFAAGWSASDADEEFGENVAFRAMNENFGPRWWLDRRRARALLAELGEPWVLKDPRLVSTMPAWLEHFATVERPPLLVWIRRNPADVADSYGRRGELPRDEAFSIVAERVRKCQKHFLAWPWPKLAIDYEQLGAAISLFSAPSYAPAHRQTATGGGLAPLP